MQKTDLVAVLFLPDIFYLHSYLP